MASLKKHSSKKHGTTWGVVYRTPDGKQTEKRGFLTERAAKAFKSRIETSLDEQTFLDPTRSKLKFDVVAEDWFRSLVDLKETTMSNYRYSLKKHVLPKWGGEKLSDISHAAIQRWIADLSEDLSPSTVRQIYLNLKSILEYAIKDNRLGKNPCKDIRLPRLQKKEKNFLKAEQVLRLAEHCGDSADVIRVLAFTGMRFGELVALNVSNIDFGRRRIQIQRSISEVGGHLVESTPKNHKARSIPFSQFLEADLQARCQGKSTTAPVFTIGVTGRLRNANFRNRVFEPALRAIQVEDPSFPTITLHNLRDTAASLAISAGATPLSLQRILGHASATLSMDTYAKLFEDDLDGVANALDQIGSQALVGKNVGENAA